MLEQIRRRGLAALLFVPLLLPACGGGGGTGNAITFLLLSVTPSVSNDLNGGDDVTIRGEGFDAVQILGVTFGGTPVLAFQVVDDETIVATTPPAPGSAGGTVTIEVTSLNAGIEILAGAYTYQGSSAPPSPQTITPTTFTPTGAQDFTIQGSNLGPPGGSVQVTFNGIGTVNGTVNGTATIVTGRAPVTPGVPPTGAITVSLSTGSQGADVPTQVAFDFAAPAPSRIPGQAPGGASRPVRVTDTLAVMCTAGQDNAWGNADDEVILLSFQPGNPPTLLATPVRRFGGTPVGNLHSANSIPVVLDATRVCVPTLGADRTNNTLDDSVVEVNGLPGAPTVVDHFVGNAANWGLVPMPIGRVDATRFACIRSGSDGTPGTGDDRLMVYDVTNPGSPQEIAGLGPVDLTAGALNYSIPQCPDGDHVFVFSPGPDATVNTGDDFFSRTRTSTGTTAISNLPFPVGQPVALSATLVACPGAGPDTTAGTGDDVLLAATDTGGGVFNVASHALGGGVNLAATLLSTRIGATGIAVPVTGAGPLSNSIVAFTDPAAGTSSSLTIAGAPLLATLGSGGLVVFGPGTDLVNNTGDEEDVFIDAQATTSLNFFGPTWAHRPAALTDHDRAFGIAAGGDGAFGTGDEQVVVFQSRVAGSMPSVTLLPMATAGAPFGGTGPLQPLQPFVPIGPNWGLAQSPGPDLTFGTFTGDDQIVLVRY